MVVCAYVFRGCFDGERALISLMVEPSIRHVDGECKHRVLISTVDAQLCFSATLEPPHARLSTKAQSVLGSPQIDSYPFQAVERVSERSH